MELSKIDLSAIAAIGHDYDHLGLLINTGEGLEYVEVPAPIQAYDGLQELAEITEYYSDYHDHAIVEDFEAVNPPSLGTREYYEVMGEVSFEEYEGKVYKCEKTVEVRVTEKISLEEEDIYLREINYEAESQQLRLEFDDGSVYEYEEITPEFWQMFQEKTLEKSLGNS